MEGKTAIFLNCFLVLENISMGIPIVILTLRSITHLNITHVVLVYCEHPSYRTYLIV